MKQKHFRSSFLQAKLFINRTVGELLFTGYEDPILEIGAAFTEDERTMPIERFGWFYKVRRDIIQQRIE